MSKPAAAVAVFALVVAALGLGYAVGASRERPREAPSRAIAHIEVPPGLASELRSALILPDALARAAGVAKILEPLGPDALGEVRTAVSSVLLDTGDVELALVGEWWARFDPEAALAWAYESGIGWHPGIITAVVRTWARQDPEAASRAVTTFQDDRLYEAATLGLVRGWDESGRAGLEEHLASLVAAGGGGRAIEAYTRGKVASGNPELAMDWAETLPEGDPQANFKKLSAMGRIAEVVVESDPQRAAAWAEEMRGDGIALMVLIRVGGEWAKHDGAAAMAWLGGLTPNRDIPTAVQETYRSWYLADPQAAGAWLRDAELVPWLDPAVAIYALHVALDQPDEGYAWAKRIQDPQRRDQIFVKIAALWLMHRPDDGEALVANAGFSEEILRKVDETRGSAERINRSPAAAGQAPEPQPPASPVE